MIVRAAVRTVVGCIIIGMALALASFAARPVLAVSRPCPENSSTAVYKGLVFDSHPRWAIRECGPTYATGAIAMVERLQRRGYNVLPLSDEAYRVAHEDAAFLTIEALKAKKWSLLSEEDIVTSDGLVLVRYYQHQAYGKLAFGIMPARDGNVYHIYLRYQ